MICWKGACSAGEGALVSLLRAACNAVKPLCVVSVRSAPASSSACTAPMWPADAAKMRGVIPVLFAGFRSTPLEISRFTTSRSPLFAALCRAVFLFSSAGVAEGVTGAGVADAGGAGMGGAVAAANNSSPGVPLSGERALVEAPPSLLSPPSPAPEPPSPAPTPLKLGTAPALTSARGPPAVEPPEVAKANGEPLVPPGGPKWAADGARAKGVVRSTFSAGFALDAGLSLAPASACFASGASAAPTLVPGRPRLLPSPRVDRFKPWWACCGSASGGAISGAGAGGGVGGSLARSARRKVASWSSADDASG
mmetsp:Transcript_68619/g.188165  ORF Transcript_68619/g.188165 Transcript_68619/m.188165 type:complete len:310 (-) Transcript_68619:1011-1940(-)